MFSRHAQPAHKVEKVRMLKVKFMENRIKNNARLNVRQVEAVFLNEYLIRGMKTGIIACLG